MSYSLQVRNAAGEAHLPIALRLDLACWDFEEAAWAIPTYNFFYCTSWTSDMLTVFAIHQVMKRVQGVECTRGSGIEAPLLFLTACIILKTLIDRYRNISARAADERIRK